MLANAFFNVGSNPWLVALSNLAIVISWVLVWEGFTNLFIGRRNKIMDMQNEKQMAIAEVHFIQKNNNT